MPDVNVRVGRVFARSTIGGMIGANLIQQANLVYLGAFKLPGGQFPNGSGQTWQYGGQSLWFNPAGNGGAGSLYSVNMNLMAAEFSVPTPVDNPVLSNLNTATMLQGFANPIEDWANDVNVYTPSTPGDVSMNHGGFCLYNGRLHATRYMTYDANADQRRSQYYRNPTLSVPSFSGYMATVGNWQNNPYGNEQHFTAGDFALVPSDYVSLLGGPVVQGLGAGNIIGNCSNGPTAFAVDLDSITYPGPIDCAPLVYYDYNPAHWTIGWWNPNPAAPPGTIELTTGAQYQWGGAASVRGIVIPVGWRSCLFFGTGTGTFGYGTGVSNPALDGEPVGDGDYYVYDEIDHQKGVHGYPYSDRCWAYDLNDLIAVKNGDKQPWEPVPYANWSLNLPYAVATRPSIMGAALDVATSRIFVLQRSTDTTNIFEPRPLIHVFQVQA